MDNLCHTLAGVALGDAGLKHRTALGMSTLVIASNLPDIDVLVFATDTLPVAFRRGWTHGVLAMVALPAALAGVMLVVARARRAPGDRPPASFGALLLLACLGVWVHVFLDFLNTYGIRLLMPFSGRWCYGDALFIIDPWMYVFLGGGILAGRWRAWQSRQPAVWPVRIGLTVAGVYVLLMLASNAWARSHVRQGLVRAGRPADTRFMVTPVFGQPLRREVIVDMGARYEKGLLWFDPFPHFRPAGYGVNTNHDHPQARAAAATPLAQQFLQWSRFPFFVLEPVEWEGRVVLADYRFSGPGGRDSWLFLEIPVP